MFFLRISRIAIQFSITWMAIIIFLINHYESVACFVDTSDKVKDEPDADLKAKITATLNTIKVR